ncbi:O-antigen ligase family protein [Flavobacterium sp.]|uniref:O-antigen ligase family protein n=1 Tax=Flavobacterium sp. TaxID=239 RepID=UPI00260DCA1C|nr:O-antigen ligase family protein [Flavobacterium sp.]MDD3004000.1 O-antigen ligase family protein [Flavobacterium sp.]
MTKDEKFYLKALLFHLGLGVLFFYFRFLGAIYAIIVLLVGIGYVIKTHNRNNEVLLLAAYFVGLDVYIKMLKVPILNEFGKYTVIVFMLLGVFYKGFSKGAFLYAFFIALLIPAIYIGVENLSLDANIRKAVAFNITGPACLGISAIYCFRRVISIHRFKDVLAMLLFPFMALLVHVFLYTPDFQQAITNTSSNSATSGGFGPNQVSTVLGLAMFVAFARLLLSSPSRIMQLINGFLVLIFAYRCIITFSRGGMFTGLTMMVVLLGVLYLIMDLKNKGKIVLMGGLGVVAGLLVWGYSSLQTGGMIDKRYANQDAAGREKASVLSGRETLMETEWQMFLDNPLLGVGVGRNKEVRMEETGIVAASHNEMTRMLAEHGSLGLLGLLILFLTPIFIYINDRSQIFALVFMVFWLLTINHAAMRIAAPAFIYALALLKVKFNENDQPPLHREQTL